MPRASFLFKVSERLKYMNKKQINLGVLCVNERVLCTISGGELHV